MYHDTSGINVEPTRFRSYLAFICVSEAEALTHEKGGPSARVLLEFHAHGAACVVKSIYGDFRKCKYIFSEAAAAAAASRWRSGRLQKVGLR